MIFLWSAMVAAGSDEGTVLVVVGALLFRVGGLYYILLIIWRIQGGEFLL